MTDFNFVIIYQLEKTYIKANALTRRSKDRSDDEENDRQKHQQQIILLSSKLNEKMKSDFFLLFEINDSSRNKILILEKNKLRII